MPWKASSVMDERLRFVNRLIDGESMSDVCREFGISRKTGYKIYSRYREHGLFALTDRSRRPVRYANQLPQQVESLIVTLKREKPHWGAKSASCWSVGLTAMSECRRRAPFMPCLTAMAWSVESANAAIAPPERHSHKAWHLTICGVPTTRGIPSRQQILVLPVDGHRSCVALCIVVRGYANNA